MTRPISLLLATAAALLVAFPAGAQTRVASAAQPATETATGDTIPSAARTSRESLLRKIEIQNTRPMDQRGINMFETPKNDGVPFTGIKLDFGAAFTQQMQGLRHSNAAAPNVVNGVNQNQLYTLGTGFNNATANLYVNGQLAPGIRVALSAYLSSRHHPETWVKDGYLQIDESPFDVQLFDDIMKYVTLRLGHFEVNYGDAHFRRTDNGNAMYNPFVGNLIMDAFTTEIGGELFVRRGALLGMVGLTGGEIRGNVTRPDDRKPSLIGKLGMDRQFTEDLRVRLTGSGYYTKSSLSNTLYSGDRAGSRYYYVIENTTATDAAQFRSGMINPAFGDKLTTLMINPFVKFRGLEVFGTIEQAEGRGATETADRKMMQYAGDVVYRFLTNEQMFVGGRYNTLEGRLPGYAADVSVDRWALGAGWFLTPNILMKGEYVKQKYNDFLPTDIRHGGKFNGFMIEGVVAF
ncbi:MAG TPA: hypothetical protein VMM18_01720 [Gemmatimonadaceae bacterium]|nr:hypothetical protein [Gemmatimonadaceae bacterium]